MALRALTENDFRAMIGTSDYGDVRLSKNGGLEKVNQHFLQRHGIKPAVRINYHETNFISKSLLNALSGTVTTSTMRQIREKLHLGLGDTTDKALSRRTIHEIFDLVDNDRHVGKKKVTESELRNAIKDYNSHKKGGELITLGGDELKMLVKRYGYELASKLEGEGGVMALGDAIKAIADRESLKAGEKSLGMTAIPEQVEDVRNYVDAGLPRTPFGLYVNENLKMRGMRRDEVMELESPGKSPSDIGTGKRELLTKGDPFVKADFGLVDFADLGKEENAKVEKMAMYNIDGSPNEDGMEKILDFIAKKYGSNVTRNNVNIQIGGESFETVQSQSGQNIYKDQNVELIKEIAKQVIRLHGKQMTPNQLLATMKVFNQVVYNLPKSFGFKITALKNHCKISSEGEDIKVKFSWEPDPQMQGGKAEEGMGPFRWEYRIDEDGMMQTEYLGKDLGSGL